MELEENFHLLSRDTSNSGPYDVHLEEFSIQAHKCQLFVETSLKIPYGSHCGLVGRNGLGKTTLLKHIGERLLPIHPDMDVLYVEQEVSADDVTVLDTVLSANVERWDLIKELRNLDQVLDNEGIKDGNGDNKLLDRYNEIQEKLVAMQADRDESLIKKILVGLGFSIRDQDRVTREFSGGWRMRISLARALYLTPTLLMLDEPTNHLDLNASIWLTEYLKGYKKSLLIVSHNQRFLNEICTDIYHIDRQKLWHYNGNYSSFRCGYLQKLKDEKKQWDKLQTEVSKMRRKSIQRAKVDEVIKKAEDKGITRPDKPYTVKIQFFPVFKLAHPVIEVNEVSFSYPVENGNEGEMKLLFRRLNFGIGLDTRAVIVGPNGVGKTTLLNLLIGNLKPVSGEIRRNNALRVGYYNQHFVDFLPLDKTPIEYIEGISTLTEDDYCRRGQLDVYQKNRQQIIRQFLGSIGLEGRIHNLPIEKLSGGQKARVALVALYVQKPHVIFLDEPTNHLDIESIEGLIEAVNDFNGAIVMVSHDMELITRTNSELWVCRDGGVAPYEGDYDDYVDEIMEEIEAL